MPGNAAVRRPHGFNPKQKWNLNRSKQRVNGEKTLTESLVTQNQFPHLLRSPLHCERRMVEAGGVEPPSLTDKPAATTCLVRREFSAVR